MGCHSKFLKCADCDTLVEALSGQCCDELMCCGKPMEILKPNQLIGLEEKHLPVVKIGEGVITACIGRVLHPMSREHSILWVELKGKNISRRIELKKGEDPIATFNVDASDGPFAIYSYCNLHGLWKTDIN